MADRIKSVIALVVWVNDIPITGGVLNLSDIISPRREFNEYRTGEKVSARCRGFKGNHECLLARIGGKEMKDEFQDLLVGSRFIQILEEFGLQMITNQQNQTVQQQAFSEGVATSESEETDLSSKNAPNQKAPRKEKRKNLSPKKTSDNHLETDLPTRSVLNQRAPQKERRKNPSPKKKTNDSHLFQVASDLELTELQESSAEYQQQLAFQIYRPHTPAKKKCVGSVVRGGLMALEQDHQVKMLIHLLLKIYSMLTPSQKATGTNSSHLQLLNESPHQKTSSSFQQWQMSTSQQYMVSENHAETAAKLQTEPGNSLSPSPCTSTYGGFTKSQLVEEISGIQDYPKAAKRLFRRLYKEEEYVGRTLTGARANKKYDGRPALKDMTKMTIIYEIMKEKFGVTAVQVREKLRDILKPSKTKAKECKFD